MRKKHIFLKILLTLLLLALAMFLAVLPGLAGEAAESGVQASVLSSSVEKRDIVRSFHGGGTLAASDPVRVTVPNGVSITALLISNGDTLSVGDPVAEIDKASAVSAAVNAHSNLELIETGMSRLNIHPENVSFGSDGISVLASSAKKGADASKYAEYSILAELHRYYEELLRELMAMSESGLLTAQADGVVSGLDRRAAEKHGGELPRSLDPVLDYYGTLLQPSEKKEFFAANTVFLCDVVPVDSLTLTVKTDEQDILSLSVGETAEITVDALPGESYTGTVSRISGTGITSGGSSKFSVDIELSGDGRLLPGMSAAAAIAIDSRLGAASVPVAALTDFGSYAAVYTALDSVTGEPISPMPVVTGISDGEYAELLSGPSVGSVFYYKYYDTPVRSAEVEGRYY